MIAARPLNYATLGDVLTEDRGIEIRCKACGRRRRMELKFFLKDLKHLDWTAPLHEAAQHFRCEPGCGARMSQIVVLKDAPVLTPARQGTLIDDAQPTSMFGRWLLAQKRRSDDIGRLAFFASRDRGFPRDGDPGRIAHYLSKKRADIWVRQACTAAAAEWRSLSAPREEDETSDIARRA